MMSMKAENMIEGSGNLEIEAVNPIDLTMLVDREDMMWRIT